MRYGQLLIQTNCDRGVDQHLTRQPAGLGSSRTYQAEGIVLEDETLVPCNCAVFAVGFASNDSHLLVEECEKRQIPCRVIGDAKSARRALDAIAEGFEAARTL